MIRCGQVALIGRPNAGKSTLLNHLLGQKVSIVSDKPQTTRHRILGILSRGECQIVLVDTPGIHRPIHLLNERMMNAVYDTLRGVDLIVQIVDASERFGKGEQFVIDLVRRTGKPTFLALNKVDLMNKSRLLPQIEFYSQQHDYQEIVPISAVSGDNVDVLLEKIEQNLPLAEFMFPVEPVTDQRERSFVGEIIREKVLRNTRQELPYSTAVLVEWMDEERRKEGFVSIAASIVVDKASQKKIVIGRAGQMIKTIGTEARREIERFLKVQKVFLDLNVKVVAGWRNRSQMLNQIGVR